MIPEPAVNSSAYTTFTVLEGERAEQCICLPMKRAVDPVEQFEAPPET
jgi:hypothetical protein